MTRTRTPRRWGAAKDRRKLKGTNRWYLRPPKSDTAADGIIGTVMKSCIHLPMVSLEPLWKVASGVDDTTDKTVLHLKIKIKQKFYRCKVHPPKLLTKYLKKIMSQTFCLLSPVSLTPLININSRISPRIFEKIWNGHNGILRGVGKTDLWKKNLKPKISCQTPFNLILTSLNLRTLWTLPLLQIEFKYPL